MPTEHNVHGLEALETTAILDVIGPPYAGGRPCTYYRLDPEYQSRMCVGGRVTFSRVQVSAVT